MRVEHGDGWELRLASAFDPGVGLESLEDDSAGAVITDPPYSARTHTGHDRVEEMRGDKYDRAVLSYGHLTEGQVAFLAFELDRVSRGWVVAMTDHVLAPRWEHYLSRAGRYVFAPLPYVAPGSRVRLAGDGPSSWTIWIVVARTAALSQWGTLRGAYIRSGGWDAAVYPGGKPVALMREVLADYSRPRDLVLDPFSGSGTTGVAALQTGRRFLGWESDPSAFEQSCRRLHGAALRVHRSHL